jgi:hypothetical protein
MGYIEKGRAKTVTKIILWMVVISFVAAIFVTWGAQRSGISFGKATALTVDGVSLTPDDLEFYRNFYRFSQARLRTGKSAVESYVWYTVSQSIGYTLATSLQQYAQDRAAAPLLENVFLTIGDLVLAKRAEAAGMRVTDKQVDDLIFDSYTDSKGKFVGQEILDRDMQMFGLATYQMGRFKEQMRRHMLARRYANLMVASLQSALDEKVYDLYGIEKQYVSFQYVEFNSPDYEAKLAPTDADLKAYLSENADEFVVAEMMEFSTTAYADSLEITENDLKTKYDEIKSEEDQEDEDYYLPERRSFQRFVVLLSPPAEGEEESVEMPGPVKETIDGFKADLQEPGIEFSTVALRYASSMPDKVKTTSITDLALDEIEDEGLADAAFAIAKAGEDNRDNPVRTTEGWEIIKLDKITPGGYKPLEEVKSRLTEEIREERADEESRKEAEAIQAAAKEGSWEETAGTKTYLTYTSKVVTVEGEDKIFFGTNLTNPKQPSDIGALLAAGEGEITKVMDLFGEGAGYVFFRVTAKGENLEKHFDFIRIAVEGRYKKVRGRQMAEEACERFAEAVKDAKDTSVFAEAAAAESYEVLTETANRLQSTKPTLVEKAIEAKVASTVGPVEDGDTFSVLLVTDRSELSEEDFEKEAPTLRRMVYAVWLGIPPVFFEEVDDPQVLQNQLRLWQQMPNYRPQLIAMQLGLDQQLVMRAQFEVPEFTSLLSAQVSYLVTNTEFIPNREILGAMFGGRRAPAQDEPVAPPGYY